MFVLAPHRLAIAKPHGCEIAEACVPRRAENAREIESQILANACGILVGLFGHRKQSLCSTC
eukprot:4560775-Pyramimonas_sp.AAC.1